MPNYIETCKNLNNILKECSNNRKWTKFTRTFKQTKWSTIRSNIPPVTNNYRIAYRISQLHENKYRPYLTRSMLTVQVNYILEMYIYTYIYIHISLACVQMEARLHASTTLKVRRLRFRGGMHASRNLHPAHHFQCFFVSRSSLRHPLRWKRTTFHHRSSDEPKRESTLAARSLSQRRRAGSGRTEQPIIPRGAHGHRWLVGRSVGRSVG